MNSQHKSKFLRTIRKPVKKVRSILLLLFKINNLLLVLDFVIPKRKDYWIFPVYFVGAGNLSDNMLAVFEAVKTNSNIKKIVLIKEKNILIENGVNVEVLNMSSFKATWFLMRAKIIFVQHSVWLDLSKARYQIIFPWRRFLINLWHGIVVKDMSHPSSGIINYRSKLEMPKYKIICSSDDDKVIMKKTFYKSDINNFWITGLPRNDFLVMPEKELPKLYKDELQLLRNRLNGKKLIIYTPTYRELNLGGVYYPFSPKELIEFKKYLHENNSILGLRYHPYLQPDFVKELIDNEYIIDLSSEIISDVRMLIREAFIIITDYSSIYIDAMYLQKKLISFAYDLEHYQRIQRGFFYEFSDVFPGEICYTFSEVMQALIKYKKPLTDDEKEKYNNITKTFFKYLDSNNTQRVIDKVNNLTSR